MNTHLKQILSRRYFLQGAAASSISLLLGRQIKGDRVRAQSNQPADLILTNERITTMDRSRPTATAVAMAGGKILAVGSDEEILQLRGANTQTVDAGGRVTIPGLNDIHSHMVRGGLNYALELRWDGIPTLAEAMDRLKEQIARTPSGQWARVVGGFSPWQFAEKRMPTLDEINAIAPDTPVFILHVYSSALLNRAALQALKIDRNFPNDRYGAEMAANAPPIKKMLEMGVPVGAGTDATRVSSYNPWLCLEWLVTGRGVGGTPLLNSQTKLERDTALRMWTDNGWFSNEENVKGRIAPGLYADLVVLNEDYFSIPEDKIRQLESVLTIVGGKVVWGAQEFAELMEPLPTLQPEWSPVNYYGGFYKSV